MMIIGVQGIWVGLLLFMVIALAGVVVVLAKFLTGAKAQSPYEKCLLLSEAERSFWRVLQQCIPQGYLLFAKVRLADIVKVKTGFDAKTRQSHYNRIQSKHVDFVICDTEYLSPRVVIELDDRSHQRASARQRDEVKNQVLEEAGLPLLRIKVRKSYNTRELQQELNAALRSETPSDAA